MEGHHRAQVAFQFDDAIAADDLEVGDAVGQAVVAQVLEGGEVLVGKAENEGARAVEQETEFL